MDNPFAYSIDSRTSFHLPLRAHVSEIDLSGRRATYEHAAPMQRRRPKYTRCKTGCLTCRKKKVKCDEAKPDCERCQNSGKTCTWPEPTGPRRTPLVADEAVHNWSTDEARPYTASSSAGLSDASSTPSSVPESPHRVVIKHAYTEDRLAPPLPTLSRRHSAPSLKSAETVIHPFPMRQAPLHYLQVGIPVPNMTVVHASRQPWNGPSNNYGAPMPPQMASSSYPPTSTQLTAAPPSTLANGLSPIPELSSLPYSHFVFAHSDDAIAVYSGDAYPGVRYTVPQAPRPGLVPVRASSGLIAVKQEADEPLEFLPPSHHLPASHPDASTLSWDQYSHVQENAAVDAYTESPAYSHEYYHVDENPSPEPAWPAEVYYAQHYSQSYSEPHHETYQSPVDSSAHNHAPVLHQPQPMVPAAIPYHH